MLNLADVESVHKSSLHNFILLLSFYFCVGVLSLASVKNLASLNPPLQGQGEVRGLGLRGCKGL